jgi:hypothetical protein
MSKDDELRPGDVPAFDDPAYDDLRGLLAEARHDEPIPVEVAAHLDEVLAGLRDEPAPVIPFRHRRSTRLLAAAAVVAVLGGAGYGIVRGLGDDAPGNLASATSDAAGSGGVNQVTPQSTNPERAPLSSGKALLRLRKSDFVPASTHQLMRSVKNLSELALAFNDLDARPSPTPPTYDSSGSAAAAKGTTACTAPDLPGTTPYAIRFDGRPATLVVHPKASGMQLVQAWSCDGKTLLASASLPG